MATIKEIIEEKLKSFGFDDSNLLIDTGLLENNIDGSQEATSQNVGSTKYVMYSIVPLLLLMPNISEGQFSKSYNVEGIKTYYSLLCSELNLPNNLLDNKIVNKSNIW